MRFEPVIGLEVHAQLLTTTKLFCGCSTRFGAPPNTQTCEVCLGMPGVLPVVNERAVVLAVRAAIGLGCAVHPTSQWSRKNYFYPDLPKGYQITQFDRPIATGGTLAFEVDGKERTVQLRRIHMEEDAAKTVHDDPLAGHRSYVDYNRGGTPLCEIVSEPELRSAAEAAAYMKALRQLLRYLDVCDGNMEEGSLRCDANVSLRPVGETKLGTRVELKNINSFRFVQQAIDFEILRQEEILRSGEAVVQETRLWDSTAKVTRSMRSKEEAHDYRYFPEPDLPDLVLPEGFVARTQESLPELPALKVKRYVAAGLSDYDARVITEDADVARFFEAALRVHDSPKAIANWVINEVLRELKGEGKPAADFMTGEAAPPVSPAVQLDDTLAGHLGELVRLIEDGTISGKIAKEIFPRVIQERVSPKKVVEEKGLTQVTDTAAIEPAVDEVLAKNPEAVQSYKAGKTGVVGFLVGQVMKATGGKANPKLVNQLIAKKLS